MAYGFAKNFLIIYDLDMNDISIQLGNTTWPDPSFLPYAVDVSQDELLVVFGYAGVSDVHYTPCAYLLKVTNSTFQVLDIWLYVAPSDASWQAALMNSDADIYSTKYTLSVSINSKKNQVLLGIPIMNTIILLDINTTTNRFSLLTQSLSNTKAIGTGKSVAWLNNNLPVVLLNTFSLDYIWISSKIFIYNITTDYTFAMRSIIPNIQQIFTTTFGPTLLSVVMTEKGKLVILDSKGSYYILLPSPPGAVSDSSSRSNSIDKPCMSGTFSSETNILPCSLCPPGTTTHGLTGQLSCVPCANNAICPLGAAFGNITSSSPLLTNINQVYPYPISPKSTVFDEILLQNVLAIFTNPSRQCLLVSPLFWAIIVLSLGVAIRLIMLFLKYCVRHPRGKKTHLVVKSLLKRTDLIGDGEMVFGGLFTLSIIVLFTFTSIFSFTFLHRYPIEKLTDNATFSCNPTLSNAQFSSVLMTTGIPPNEIRAPIFALLNNQSLILDIDFINTFFKCTDISAREMKDTIINLAISSCNHTNSTLSMSLVLPSHNTEIQILLADRNTIGALRFRLRGTGSEENKKSFESNYELLDLDFAQTFSVSNRLLTQQPSCTLQLTKVINHTYPLSESEETSYSAIWLPYFSVNLNRMFVDEHQYTYSTNSASMLSIVIQETSYYMLNAQKPIIGQSELILANIAFIVECLELCGLIFLSFKLIVLPLLGQVINSCHDRTSKDKLSENSFDSFQTLSCRL